MIKQCHFRFWEEEIEIIRNRVHTKSIRYHYLILRELGSKDLKFNKATNPNNNKPKASLNNSETFTGSLQNHDYSNCSQEEFN